MFFQRRIIVTLLAALCMGSAQNSAADEFQTLAREIQLYQEQGYPERLLEETLRRDALIQPADRDPLDVLLRRTLSELSGVTGARSGKEAMVDPSCPELLRHLLADLGTRTAPGGGIEDDVDGFAQRGSP